jgi:hypothetical protein
MDLSDPLTQLRLLFPLIFFGFFVVYRAIVRRAAAERVRAWKLARVGWCVVGTGMAISIYLGHMGVGNFVALVGAITMLSGLLKTTTK